MLAEQIQIWASFCSFFQILGKWHLKAAEIYYIFVNYVTLPVSFVK